MTLLPDPQFPPLLHGHGVDRGLNSLDVAVSRVRADAASAGDVYWSRRRDRLHYALVLEPEVGATAALGMVVVAMVATGDAIGSLAPPEMSVTYRWPGTIMANGAEVGSIGAVLPAGADDTQPPGWLVLRLTVAIAATADAPEPGHRPDRTSLHDEGCHTVDRTTLAEAVSRHLLLEIDTWSREGLGRTIERWLERCPDRGRPVALPLGDRRFEGVLAGLDEHGGLVLDDGGTARTVTIAQAIAAEAVASAMTPLPPQHQRCLGHG